MEMEERETEEREQERGEKEDNKNIVFLSQLAMSGNMVFSV